MLTLAVAQIEATMTDGERSVSELSESFTYIADKISGLVQAGEKLNEEANTSTVTEIQINASEIHHKVNGAIVAFQFYDRLTQRIHHVKSNLEKLSYLIADPNQLYNPDSWKLLQTDICQNYTMEEERIMFQHIMQGASVQQALEIYQHHFSQNDSNEDESGDEVELF